jgi:hypothetical protein
VQGDDQEPYQGVYLRKAVEIAANFSAKARKDAAMRPVWTNQTMGLLSRSCYLFIPARDDLRSYQLGISDWDPCLSYGRDVRIDASIGGLHCLRSRIISDGSRISTSRRSRIGRYRDRVRIEIRKIRYDPSMRSESFVQQDLKDNSSIS